MRMIDRSEKSKTDLEHTTRIDLLQTTTSITDLEQTTTDLEHTTRIDLEHTTTSIQTDLLQTSMFIHMLFNNIS